MRKIHAPTGVLAITLMTLTAPDRAAARLLLPNTFGYSATSGGWSGNHPRIAADVNGDRKADLVGFAGDGVYVALAKTDGTGFAAPTKWSGDFGANSWSSATHPRFAADVDGNGRADIVGFANDGVYVAFSKPTTGFEPMLKALDSMSAHAGWLGQGVHPRAVADVNGDKKADLVGFANDGVYVALANVDGKSFATIKKWHSRFCVSDGWDSNDTYPRTLADVDGDQKADIVGFAADGVYVALSKPDQGQFGPSTRWIAGYGVTTGGWTYMDKAPRMMADVNGDLRADIVGFGDNGVYVSVSQGSSFGAPAYWVASYGYQHSWVSQSTAPRVVADFTGDGLADIVGFGDSGVLGSFNVGGGFEPAGPWDNTTGPFDYTFYKKAMDEINRIRGMGVTTGNTFGQFTVKCTAAATNPVGWIAALHEAAYRHSEDMVVKGLLQAIVDTRKGDPHLGSNGKSWADRVSAAGCQPAGENVQYSYGGSKLGPEALVHSWLGTSADHCSIVMTPDAKLGGLGIHTNGTLTFYTLDVARSCK